MGRCCLIEEWKAGGFESGPAEEGGTMLTREERAMSYYRAVYRALCSIRDAHGGPALDGIYLDRETGEYRAAASRRTGWALVEVLEVRGPDELPEFEFDSEDEFVGAAMGCWGIDGVPGIPGEGRESNELGNK